jgi:predicted nucleic acid-binding protein
MQVLDASSIIHAWDNYPINQFPGLWEWISTQIEEDLLTISEVAFEEVHAKVPECADWLKECEIDRLKIDNDILDEAMRIKGLLGIDGDQYHAKGVGENDILIIATASVHGVGLISDEGRQQHELGNLARSKIPKVCQMEEVRVHCSSFIELIKGSEAVFR